MSLGICLLIGLAVTIGVLFVCQLIDNGTFNGNVVLVVTVVVTFILGLSGWLS